MRLRRHVGLHRQSNCIYILTMPCIDHISVWNQFDFATDHRLGRTNWRWVQQPRHRRFPHIVTFRLTITRIADLITAKATCQQNSIGYIIHKLVGVPMIVGVLRLKKNCSYKSLTSPLTVSDSPSQCQECERSCVGNFIMLIFLATRFYSPISLFHDLTTIFAVDRHYDFRV